MFDRDVQIRGKHATYWKALTRTPGNAREEGSNFKIFENYIHVYMAAPIIGLVYGRRGAVDPDDHSKDTAGMLAEILIKNQSKLKYIYRLIILLDESEGLTKEEKIDRAFRENENEEAVKAGMALFRSYFLGGLELLYENFVERCVTEQDYIDRMYDFVEEFRREQKMDANPLDINELLKYSQRGN